MESKNTMNTRDEVLKELNSIQAAEPVDMYHFNRGNKKTNTKTKEQKEHTYWTWMSITFIVLSVVQVVLLIFRGIELFGK